MGDRSFPRPPISFKFFEPPRPHIYWEQVRAVSRTEKPASTPAHWMVDGRESVAVDFPLRGEWVAVRTPAHRIPSHGTDYFAQRYAFDFVSVDSRRKPYGPPAWSHLLGKLAVEECYGWAKAVCTPFAGVIGSLGDGWPDGRVLNFWKDYLRTAWFSPKVRGSDLRPLAGNHVIIECGQVFALLAHLRCASITVRVGQPVQAGQRIAEVGNSGNSTAPHLHFQLMDGPDPLSANGVPGRFRRYERHNGLAWETVSDGIPRRMEPVRFGTSDPAGNFP